MPESTHPLPANRAFVIQLQPNAGAVECSHRGRIEHLASGRAMRFGCEEELWAFVDGILSALAKGSESR